MIQAYAIPHFKMFSLGFGIGQARPGIFDISLGIGVFTVGLQFVKQPKPSDLLKELNDYDLQRMGEKTSNRTE